MSHPDSDLRTDDLGELAAIPSDEATAPADLTPQGRHRPTRRVNRPAAAVTAVVAAGAMGLAGYTTFAASSPLDSDEMTTSMGRLAPTVGEEAVDQVGLGVMRQQAKDGSIRIQRIEDDREAIQQSAKAADKAATKAGKRADEIAAEREAERKAKAAAEQAAAEQAAAEQAAAEQAAAEKAAAEEAAADEAAAQERESEAASRDQERAPAPDPAPVSSGDPRSIARGMLGSYGWGSDQFGCLDSLWNRESGWNTYAKNPSSGAYGIPQSLPGSKMASAGSDWQTNPATQIRWGLGYISSVYGSPCGAWAHSESVGWY